MQEEQMKKTKSPKMKRLIGLMTLASAFFIPQHSEAGMTLKFYGDIIGLGDPIGGNPVQALYDDDQFPNQVAASDAASAITGIFSDFISASSGNFEYPQPFEVANSGLDNYGAVATGAFYAPITANYRFFIRSDDSSAFFVTESPIDLSSLKGSNPPVPDATESDCCDAFTDDETATGTFALNAGDVRFLTMIWKEGGGGDWMQVGLSINGGPVEVLNLGHVQRHDYTPDSPPEDGLRMAGVGPDGFQSEFDVLANESRPVSFFVEFDEEFDSTESAPEITWSIDGEVVEGQKGTMITFLASIDQNGSEVTAAVEGLGDISLSLTVDADLDAPTVSSVTANGNPSGILVTFSEPVDQASAEDTGNYTISGKTISSATLIGNNQVLLDIGEYDDSGLTITISGVQDISEAGNTMDDVTTAVAMTPGLILYLPLDQDASDVTGRYNGQENGVFFSSDGDRGDVAEFDGQDSHINLGIINEMQGGVRQFSIAAWFKREEDRSSDNTNHNVSNVLVAHSFGSANDNFEIGSAGANIEAYLDTAGRDANLPVIPAGIANDTWHHALFVYDADASNEVRIYVDGQLVFENDQYGGVLDDGSALNTTQWTVGLARPDNQLWGDFQGLMDDVAFWSIPLSAEMAAALADGSVTPLSVGAVATGQLVLESQPASMEVSELADATFTANVTGSDPAVVVVEWYRDGVLIPGQNGLSLTLPAVSPDDSGAKISFVAYNNNGTFNRITSEEATLTVIADTEAPQIASLKAIAGGVNLVTVVFDEVVEQSSAETAANYTLSGDVTVNSATLQGDGQTVILTTSDIERGTSYTVSATGVADLSAAANASDTSMEVEAIANYFEIVQADDPVRFWRLDDAVDQIAVLDVAVGGNDVAIDRHGSVLNGVTFGAPSLIFSDQENTAATFSNADNAEIDLPISPDLNEVNGPWAEKTVELWFRANSFPPIGATGAGAVMGLFEQGGNDRAMGMFIWRLPEDTDPNKAHLVFFAFNRLSDGAGSPWFEPANGSEGIYVSSEITLGETYHAVGIMNGSNDIDGTASLYVNGDLADEIGGVGILYNHTGDVNIGRGDMRIPDNSTGVWTSFDGVIDEVALYNTALTGAQVTRHWDMANDGQGDGPAALSSNLNPATALERTEVEFSATFTGAPPVSTMWTINGVENPGTIEGNKAVLRFRTTMADNGATIQLTVSNEKGQDTSNEVTLTVTPETQAPQVVSIAATGGNINNVIIEFDEDLDPDSATDTANYTIEGLTVNSATLSADGTTVTLETSEQTSGQDYSVAIDGVKDASAAGNAFSGSSPVKSLFNYTLAVLGSSPNGYWKFGETEGTTANNEIVLNWNGTYAAVNAVAPPALGAERLVVGAPDTSIRFDNNRINLPDNGNLNTGGPYRNRSIEFWFNAEKLPRSLGDGAIPEKAVIFEAGGATRGISIYLSGTEESDSPQKADLYFHIWNRGANDGPGAPWGFDIGGPVFIKSEIDINTTYYAAMVMEGSEDANETLDGFLGTLKGYINGEEVGSIEGPGLLYNHGDDAGIGLVRQNVVFHDEISNTDATFPYTGRLDELALYNSVLSPEDISFHYTIGTTPVDPIAPPSDAAFTSVSFADGNITLQWDGSATLQSADSVNGPWTDVPDASSPFSEAAGADQKFYRLNP